MRAPALQGQIDLLFPGPPQKSLQHFLRSRHRYQIAASSRLAAESARSLT
jgi:hypothetical protein